MAPTSNNIGSPETIVAIQNASFDPQKRIQAVGPLSWDGSNMVYGSASDVAVKVTTVGSVIYVAIAPPGTAQSSALWQCKKVDTTTGVVITWADGNTDFDNVATDLTALSYS